VKHLLENLWPDVLDEDFARLGLLKVVVKHGRENGTSGSQDGDMATDFLLVFEQEFDIAVRLLDKHFLQLLRNQLATTELLGL
jgi:hypothetical protein